VCDAKPTEGVVDANGPGHALLTLDGGEHLGRVLECHGSFAERVADGEEIDEQGDGTDLGSSLLCRIEQRETSGQEEDAHQREGLQRRRVVSGSLDSPR
jgi:hypothetical protein